MTEYTAPSLTHVGSFKKMTKALGILRCKDAFRLPALWTILPGC